jgi:hypothetical protein
VQVSKIVTGKYEVKYNSVKILNYNRRKYSGGSTHTKNKRKRKVKKERKTYTMVEISMQFWKGVK